MPKFNDNKRTRDDFTNEELELIEKQRLEWIQSNQKFQRVFQEEADKSMDPGTNNENPFKFLVSKEIKKGDVDCPTARERQGIQKNTDIHELEIVPTLLGLDEAEREISRQLQNNEFFEREAKTTYYKNRKADLYRTMGKPIKLKGEATTRIIEHIDQIAEWRYYRVKNQFGLSYYDYIRNKADEEENLLYSLIEQYQDLFDYYYDEQKYGNLNMLNKKIIYEGILRREGQQAVPDIYDSKN